MAVRSLGTPDPWTRIWTAPDWPAGTPVPGSIAVEWRGAQYGHPSNHFLIGGHLADEAGIAIVGQRRFRGSLHGKGDPIMLRLDPFYRIPIERALARSEAPMQVTIVGESEQATSPLTMCVGVLLVASLLTDGIPDDDAALTQLRSDCYAPAREALEGWTP